MSSFIERYKYIRRFTTAVNIVYSFGELMVQTKMPDLLTNDNVRKGLCGVGGVFVSIYVADLGYRLGSAAAGMGLKRSWKTSTSIEKSCHVVVATSCLGGMVLYITGVTGNPAINEIAVIRWTSGSMGHVFAMIGGYVSTMKKKNTGDEVEMV
jgi:hypothetical protein